MFFIKFLNIDQVLNCKIYTLNRLFFSVCIIILQSCRGGIPECDDVNENKLKNKFISLQTADFTDKFWEDRDNEELRQEKKDSIGLGYLESKRKEYNDIRLLKIDSIKLTYSQMKFLDIIELSDDAGLLYHTCNCKIVYDLNGEKDTINYVLAQSDDDFNAFITKINSEIVRRIVY